MPVPFIRCEHTYAHSFSFLHPWSSDPVMFQRRWGLSLSFFLLQPSACSTPGIFSQLFHLDSLGNIGSWHFCQGVTLSVCLQIECAQHPVQIRMILHQNCQENQYISKSKPMNTQEDLHKDSLLSQHQDQPSSSALEAKENQNQFELTPLEKLIDKVGGEHTYQFKSFIIFNIMWFLTAWMLVGQGFFFDNSYTCIATDSQPDCEKLICGLPQKDRPAAMKSHANSIVFAFDREYFICENEYLRPILQSLLYVGSLLGFFVIPYIADNWGRKIAIRISWGIFVIGIIFMSIADSPNMIGMGQLLTGFGCNPAITLCYSFLNEQVLRAKRQYYGVIIQVFLAIGECTIAFMFMPDYTWRVVCYILLALVALTWVSLNYLVESPKFLISKSKKMTLEVLNSIAKRNGRPELEEKEMEAIATVDQEKVQGTSLVDLFKYKSLRWPTIAGGVVFLAIQIIYYGTLLNLDHIGYSKLVNQQIIGVSQGLGYLAAEIVISRILRKKWSLIGMGLSSLLCFVLAVFIHFQNDSNIETMKIVETIGLTMNRFVLCAFWGLFYVYIAEMYPTKVRSMGFGWTSGMGTIGSSLAPYMIFYSEKAGINSWIPPGVVGLIGFVSIFCLTESFKKPLYDEIEEVRLKGKWELSDDEDQTNERETGQTSN